MNYRDVAKLAGELTALKFFPPDDDGRLAVMKLIGRMTSDEEQVRWLVNRMLELFDEWPGPRTMRAVLCRKYRPADGVEATHYSAQYPNGIPSENPLASPPRIAPTETAEFVADFSLVKSLPAPDPVRQLIPAERNRQIEFAKTLKDIATNPKYRLPEAPPPERKPIRQSEIISANEQPLDNPEPRPEGSYQRITPENFNELLERERKSRDVHPAS